MARGLPELARIQNGLPDARALDGERLVRNPDVAIVDTSVRPRLQPPPGLGRRAQTAASRGSRPLVPPLRCPFPRRPLCAPPSLKAALGGRIIVTMLSVDATGSTDRCAIGRRGPRLPSTPSTGRQGAQGASQRVRGVQGGLTASLMVSPLDDAVTAPLTLFNLLLEAPLLASLPPAGST
jgi:hypothetical protein